MKLLKLVLVISFVALFVAACGNSNAPTANPPIVTNTPAAPPKADEWAAARNLYEATCVNCHKADGTGGAVSFSEGDPPLKVPTLKGEKQANEPDAEYIEQIKEGGDGMPGFKKKYNDGQIAQLVAYIRHEFQGKDVKPPMPAAESKPAETTPKTTISAGPQSKDGKMEKEGEHEKGEKKDDDDKKK